VWISRYGIGGTVAEMSDFILFSLGISSVVITATMIIFLWHL
jgi:hypothetical protein